MDKFDELKNKFPEIKVNVSLKNYCNYKIGGVAKGVYEANSAEDLVEIVRFSKREGISFYLIGKGTNVLFLDEGFDGLIIVNKTNEIVIMEKGDKNSIIRVDSGVTIAGLISFGLKNNIGGMASFYCLPGTIGGAIYGNAGSFGMEIKDVLFKVEFYDLDLDIIVEKDRDELYFGYRDSIFKKKNNWIILKAYLKCENLDSNLEEYQKNLKEIAVKRTGKQPFGASCGSFFKNVYLEDGTVLYAGKMIEECGLKGEKIGGAQISPQHGNFILNKDNASSEDVLKLASLAKEKVRERFSVELQEEVRVGGGITDY